ncbi:transketolase family protein [Candidatus Izemoplasma sp. B36]|uniref:transketolase family protein n=1 Tax=Candidatus Izemoplasma sp. B36 TaxID=3242468 RepID=UPI00355901A3
MIYKKSNIRFLSILGQRGAFGYALTELVKEKSDIIALTGDLCITSGLERFYKKYPDKLINAGIAEQNLFSISAGMATMDYVPFATTFSNFAALRSNEQIRHFAGYLNENIKIVGFGAGFAMGMFGTTHYAIEDISAIRSIPNLTIFSPADCLEVAKVTEAAYNIKGPVYIRLTGVMNHPIVYKDNYNFEVGKSIRFFNGKDIAIFATGIMVSKAIKLKKFFDESNIGVTIFNIHTIKPFDKTSILESLNFKLIVSLEEHSVIGGLGSVIADNLCNFVEHPKLLKIGTKKEYQKAGDYEYMLNANDLSNDEIYMKIIEIYNIEGEKENE